MYYGTATLHCFICAQSYQGELVGCCVSGLDNLCDECVTKLWNGDSEIFDQMEANYAKRIQEIESALPPEVGPERQAMKREIIALLETLSHLMQGEDRQAILRDLLKEVADRKSTRLNSSHIPL